MKNCLYRQAVLSACLFGGSACGPKNIPSAKLNFSLNCWVILHHYFVANMSSEFNRLLGGRLWVVFGKYDCEGCAHVDFALLNEDFSFVILFDDTFCQ